MYFLKDQKAVGLRFVTLPCENYTSSKHCRFEQDTQMTSGTNRGTNRGNYVIILQEMSQQTVSKMGKRRKSDKLAL